MTRKQFRLRFASVSIFYFCAILFAMFLYSKGDKPLSENETYTVYIDLIPLIFAIPAVYLGFCFQRRQSFLQSLKQVWTNLITAVQNAIQYTHQGTTTPEEYGGTLEKLSSTIDELRGVYKNKYELKDEIGLYTFESLKNIHDEVSDLGHGVLSKTRRDTSRKEIVANWKSLRRSFLRELDRSEPTYIDSPFIEY